MTDREKIIETLRASGYGYFITHEKANADEALAYAADALIADRIGDVSEWKRRAEVAEQKATVWKDCANKWQKYYKEQAEREIATEKQISIDECLERLNEK